MISKKLEIIYHNGQPDIFYIHLHIRSFQLVGLTNNLFHRLWRFDQSPVKDIKISPQVSTHFASIDNGIVSTQSAVSVSKSFILIDFIVIILYFPLL